MEVHLILPNLPSRERSASVRRDLLNKAVTRAPEDQTAFSINLQAYLHFWLLPHVQLLVQCALQYFDQQFQTRCDLLNIQWLAERSNCIFNWPAIMCIVLLNILLFYKLFDSLLNLAIHWATFVDRNEFSFNTGIKKSALFVEGKG